MLHSKDEKYVLAKMDALIKTQFGNYENNFEYSYFFTDLIIIKEAEKSLRVKELEIDKFQTYNNRRLDLEEQNMFTNSLISNLISINSFLILHKMCANNY